MAPEINSGYPVYEVDASRQTNRTAPCCRFMVTPGPLNDNLLKPCTLPEIRASCPMNGDYILTHMRTLVHFTLITLFTFPW